MCPFLHFLSILNKYRVKYKTFGNKKKCCYYVNTYWPLTNLPSKYPNMLTTNKNSFNAPHLSSQTIKHTSKGGANRTPALKTKVNVDIVLQKKYTFHIRMKIRIKTLYMHSSGISMAFCTTFSENIHLHVVQVQMYKSL